MGKTDNLILVNTQRNQIKLLNSVALNTVDTAVHTIMIV